MNSLSHIWKGSDIFSSSKPVIWTSHLADAILNNISYRYAYKIVNPQWWMHNPVSWSKFQTSFH